MATALKEPERYVCPFCNVELPVQGAGNVIQHFAQLHPDSELAQLIVASLRGRP